MSHAVCGNRELEFGSYDVEQDCEDNDNGFVEISNIFVMVATVKVCQMLSWWPKNSLYSINI